MKTSSIYYLFILFACAILSPVFGNPASTCYVPQSYFELPEDHAQYLLPTAEATIKYIKENAAKINEIPVCFYSGNTTIKGVEVRSFAKIPDLQKKIQPIKIHILEDIIIDAGQNTNSWQDPEFRAVSKTLAEHTSGQVYVLLGQKVLPTSVYIQVERPILINSPKVKGFNTYQVQTDGSITKQ